MLKRYIIILVISILIVVFAVQNVEKVNIKMFMFDVEASLSLIMIITLALGALITLVLFYQEIRQRSKTIRDLEKKIEHPDHSYSTSESAVGADKDQKS